MACSSCGSSSQVRIHRGSSGSSPKITAQKQVLLRPQKKLGPATVLRPANKDKYRA